MESSKNTYKLRGRIKATIVTDKMRRITDFTKEELDELLSKMPVAVSEQVKSELNDKVNGLPLKSGGKNTINQEDLVQIVKSQTNSPKEVSEKIRQSIQASKKASQKENEKNGAEEDELHSGADNLIQNCPLKEGTAITYSHKDEYGNDIQTTYVIKKKLKQGDITLLFIFSYKAYNNLAL